MNSEERAELHNEYAQKFVHEIVGRMLKEEDTDYGDLMVLFESCTYGVLLMLHKQFKFNPDGAAVMVDECVLEATKRFAAYIQRKGLT